MARYVVLYGGLWEVPELAYSVLLSKLQTGQEFVMDRLGKRLGDVVDISHTTREEAFRLQMEFYENRRGEDPVSEGHDRPHAADVQARSA